ncbi:MAG: hypothetical protein OK455_04960 [Thaumarchaeota archaeon]|nr:hypothetical protein [Nitrososphaerota archaeon]
MPNGQAMSITGTFKVVSSAILATNTTKSGITTTVSKTTVARNDSTSPGVVTSMITIVGVSRVNTRTGSGTSFSVGTLTGTIAGSGPGVCAYRSNSTLTGQGTPHASSQTTHWITECTGGMSGITETTTSIGKGVFSAVVRFGSPTPAAQTTDPYP